MPARFTEEDAARLGLGRRRGEPSPEKPKPRRKRQRSAGERELEAQLRAWQIGGWTTEHRFDAGTGGRGWRFDFAWPELKLAVEVDGGVHRIADRFAGDLDKHNALQLAGWVLLRFSPEQCKSGEAVSTIRALEPIMRDRNPRGDAMSTTYRIVEATRYALMCDTRSEDGKSDSCALVGEYHCRSAAEAAKKALEAMVAQEAIDGALSGGTPTVGGGDHG